MTGRQLPLPFAFAAQYDSTSFLEDDSNAAARAWLAAVWPEKRLAIWGGAGRGKTHLVHLWAQRTGGLVLAGSALNEWPALGAMTSLAIDDADTTAEEPLLHLLNAAAEAGCHVLLAARDAPARWSTQLPDLASRLRATTAVAIDPPNDAMLRGLLARLLADRQLAIQESVQEWLLSRLPRDPGVLREAAARLDQASLAAGGRVSRTVAEAVVASFAETYCR